MSSHIRAKTRMLETMQEFIESNQLGFKLARASLGKTPKSLVIEDISSLDKLGRTGILLVKVKFNSDEGPFEGMLAIKEFSTADEAKRLVKLNNWLSERIQNNPRVYIPQIYSAGGKSIVYEGIDGISYDDSRDEKTKLRMAANAIATFHTAFTSPVNVERYEVLLHKVIKELPVSEERKSILLSYGRSYLAYYKKDKSGTISYGDFHPGNLILSKDYEISYLIDPEFVENDPSADRLEDVSNFLVFEAYMEFLNEEKLTRTLQDIEIFLNAYDEFLQHYETSLSIIYENTHWLALIFHLGLIALIKGAVAVQSVKQNNSETDDVNPGDQSGIEEIIQSYRLCREIWFIGVEYLPKEAIPRTLDRKPSKEGHLITWPLIYEHITEVLKRDEVFGMFFKFPPQIKEITLEAAIELYKTNDKKGLEQKVKELEEFVGFSCFKVNKTSIEINIDWKNLLGLPEKPELNWKESCETIYKLWKRRPINLLISIMTSFQSLKMVELEESQIFPKKSLKNILKEAENLKLVTITKENVILNSQWRSILGISPQFNPAYFN